jgi:hypothetical protein
VYSINPTETCVNEKCELTEIDRGDNPASGAVQVQGKESVEDSV